MKWMKWLPVVGSVGILAMAGYGDEEDNSPAAPLSSDDIAGTWEIGDGSFTVTYRANGTYVDESGDGGLYWSLYGDTLALSISDNPIYLYTVSLKGSNRMILSPICSEWSVLIRDDCPGDSGEFKRL
ncbi:MAG: hypothetical protein HOC74_16250 [Gemmatimonadetes bacterium]|nr:hypothetical protein [Gemmatimonadota bacterium]